MNIRNLLLLVGLAAFAAVLVLNMGSTLSQYSDFAAAREARSEVHVVATWVQREESHYDSERDRFSFYLADSLGNVAPCVYHDPKPVNFDTAERVVVQGKFSDNVFQVSKIQLKCPSKYEETELGPAAKYSPPSTTQTEYPG